ncbi:hypothetical protein SORBI_3009G239200 [Sorghum bicolor]|uniref:Uncharacterized protein n=1 Tax=Sorghum bicolor TaxID=4558 RepID=A0A1B6P9X7_SORBI|nr:hypothetical protein SORBI_3009G239200 [Sorghum bicolor]
MCSMVLQQMGSWSRYFSCSCSEMIACILDIVRLQETRSTCQYKIVYLFLLNLIAERISVWFVGMFCLDAREAARASKIMTIY